MSAEIYYSETHPRSLLVIATLNYLDIKFSAKKLDMDKGEHTTAAMKKISPDGLLPALKDGDLCLSRAQAIAKYMISEETKGTDFYPDDDLKTRIKIDAFCDYDSMDLRPALAELVMYYSKQDEMADQKGRILDTWQKVIKFLNGMVTRVEGKLKSNLNHRHLLGHSHS